VTTGAAAVPGVFTGGSLPPVPVASGEASKSALGSEAMSLATPELSPELPLAPGTAGAPDIPAFHPPMPGALDWRRAFLEVPDESLLRSRKTVPSSTRRPSSRGPGNPDGLLCAVGADASEGLRRPVEGDPALLRPRPLGNSEVHPPSVVAGVGKGRHRSLLRSALFLALALSASSCGRTRQEDPSSSSIGVKR
jgi:hypothetical protein